MALQYHNPNYITNTDYVYSKKDFALKLVAKDWNVFSWTDLKIKSLTFLDRDYPHVSCSSNML